MTDNRGAVARPVWGDVQLWIVTAAFVMSFGEPFLNGIVGGLPALLLSSGPLIAFAGWNVFVRAGLSPDYRRKVYSAFSSLSSVGPQAALLVSFCLLLLFSIAGATLRGSFDPFRGIAESLRWISAIAAVSWIWVRSWVMSDRAYPGRVALCVLLATAVLNILLLAVGFRNSVLQAELIGPPEPGVMLGLLGIHFDRIVLPLGAGTRGIHSAAGVAVGCAYFLLASGRQRVLGVFAAVASVICLLITDSRGGMLAAIGGTAVVIAPGFLRLRLRWLALALPVLPVALIGLLGALQDGELVRLMVRPGENSVGLLSGRPLIWASIASALLVFDVRHIFGFGQLGQVASGVNANYAFLFESSYASTETAGAHNTLLQVILDLGYVGAVVVVLLVWQALARFSGWMQEPEHRVWGGVGVAGITCIVLLGMTDSTLSVTNSNTLLLFLLLNSMAISTAKVDPMRPE